MKRKITISVMAPVTVELLVKPQDPEDLDGSWDIDCVLRADLNHAISPRSIYENADDETLEEINNLATQAPDRNDRGEMVYTSGRTLSSENFNSAEMQVHATSAQWVKPMDAPGPDLKREKPLSRPMLEALRMVRQSPKPTTTRTAGGYVGGGTAKALMKMGLVRYVKHEDHGTAVQITAAGIKRLIALGGPE